MLKFPSIPSDWPIRAMRYDPAVSSAHPVRVMCNAHDRSSPPVFVDVHACAETGIVLSGAQERLFLDGSLPVKEGDVWLGGLWEPHGFRATETGTCSVVIVFLPEFLGEEVLADVPWLSLFAAAPSRRPRVTDEVTRAQVLHLARQIATEAERADPDWEYAVRLDLCRLLLALKRTWAVPEDGAPARMSARGLARIMPVTARLYANPADPISLTEAAAACGLSPHRFNQLFRQTLGSSFGRFCRQARLAFAAHQLAVSDLSIDDVATRGGFR